MTQWKLKKGKKRNQMEHEKYQPKMQQYFQDNQPIIPRTTAKKVKIKKPKRIYKCLLIANLYGSFATGQRLLEFSHSQILGKNFFKDILTPYSLLMLNRQFQGQIIPTDKDYIIFTCQVRNISKQSQENWNYQGQTIKKVVQKAYKKIRVRCSRIHAKFQSVNVKERKVQVLQVNELPENEINEMQELIVLQITDFGLPNYFEFYKKDPLIISMMCSHGQRVPSPRRIKVSKYKKSPSLKKKQSDIELIYQAQIEDEESNSNHFRNNK